MKQHARRQSQRGLSILELLVSVAIGLVILTAIGTAYINTTNTTRQREEQAQLNEPARNVLHLLRQNLMQAGYVDLFDLDAANHARAASIFIPGNLDLANMFIRDPSTGTINAPITQTFPALTPLFGCDGAMTGTPNATATAGTAQGCDAGAVHATRHTLQITYQGAPSNATNATNSLTPADPTTGEGLDCLQQSPVAGVFVVINRFAVNDDAQLQCEGSGAVGAQTLAEGVEEFVLRYQMSAPGIRTDGVAAGSGQQRYIGAGDVAASAQGWAGVTAVEICIVAATPQASGPAAPGTVDLQPTRPTCARESDGSFSDNIDRDAGDRRLWKRYTSVVSLRNAVFATPL